MLGSTTAAGTISQIARGLSNLLTRSWNEELPVAFSPTNSFTTFGDLSKTTHWCRPFSRRRTIFDPILPRQIIPSCIAPSLGPSSARVGLLAEDQMRGPPSGHFLSRFTVTAPRVPVLFPQVVRTRP